MVFLLYGYVKLQPVLSELHILKVIDYLHFYCPTFSQSDFNAVQGDLKNLLDLVIYRMAVRDGKILKDRV